MKQRKGTTRRTAAEWADEVRAWRRSGKTAAGYARRRGFKATTLSWWAWKLERDGILDRTADVERVEVVATKRGLGPMSECSAFTMTRRLRPHVLAA